MNIEIKILDALLYDTKEKLPKYETQGSIGIDLRTSKDIVIHPDCTMLVGTGFAVSIIDPNVGAFIYPRSGLGHKEGLVLGNLTGVIDSDYQGEIKLSVWNRGTVVRYYSRGDRIAQLVFQPIVKPKLWYVNSFQNETDRGANGFGSTGVKS